MWPRRYLGDSGGALFAPVALLAAIQFVIVVDETTMSLLGPVIAHDLGLGDEVRHLLVTPFAGGFICGLPLTVLLLRRCDPRRVVAPATVAFAAAAGGGALTYAEWALVAVRAAQGLTAAVAATGTLAALHVITRHRSARGRYFAMFSLVSGSGAVVALLIIGPLATHSWRLCFAAVAAAALMCAAGWLLSARLAPTTHAAAPAAPVVDASTSRGPERRRRWVYGAIVASNAVLAAVVITTSFALQQDHGWTPGRTGWGFLPLNLAAAVGAVLVAVINRRVSVPLMVSGGAALAAGCGVVGLAGDSVASLLIGTVVVGVGIGTVFPLVNDAGLATAGVLSIARAGAIGAAQQIGLATGALVAAAHSGAMLIALAAAVGMFTVAAVAVFRTEHDGARAKSV